MNRVKLLREQRGLTQDQLADLSGVPQSTISRIENDALRKYGASIANLQKIAAALGVSVDDLLGEDHKEVTA